MNPLRWAAVLSWVNAAGFGLPVLPVIRHLRAEGDLPNVLGLRAFGGGHFEGLGPSAFSGLLLAFLLVCTGEAVAGLLLWRGRRSGGMLSIALLPLGAIFWVGFALPFPPLNALARTAVILHQWRRLDPGASRRPGVDRRGPRTGTGDGT